MSERLTDADLNEIALRFPTHLGEPMISVLIQRALAELRHLRALALTADERLSLFDIKADIEDTWDGDDKRTVRALALIERLLALSPAKEP